MRIQIEKSELAAVEHAANRHKLKLTFTSLPAVLGLEIIDVTITERNGQELTPGFAFCFAREIDARLTLLESASKIERLQAEQDADALFLESFRAK